MHPKLKTPLFSRIFRGKLKELIKWHCETGSLSNEFTRVVWMSSCFPLTWLERRPSVVSLGTQDILSGCPALGRKACLLDPWLWSAQLCGALFQVLEYFYRSDWCLHQADKEGVGEERKTFCIITTFRKEHALKGNIFSQALGCLLLHTEYLASLYYFPLLFLIPFPAPKHIEEVHFKQTCFHNCSKLPWHGFSLLT